jgi:hypothetical protein
LSGEQFWTGGVGVFVTAELLVLVDVPNVVGVSKVVGGELRVVEGVLFPVTMHEQAEDTRDGIPEHCETKVGNPVVAVWRAVV